MSPSVRIAKALVLIRILFTLGLGALGGALFAFLHLPAPWLAGSMIAAILAVLFGAKLSVPVPFRSLAFIILGVQIGSSVTMQTLTGRDQRLLCVLPAGARLARDRCAVLQPAGRPRSGRCAGR
ncbi:MAG: AbrB family transcriptional regulator [Alphaproteobacteria bacterium]|nr:MAG: AbrB family transcriptional regulator [Alphaproteobacteria bacterium]